MFTTIYHGRNQNAANIIGMPESEELLDKTAADTALSVDLMSVPSGMSLRVEYNSSKYTREFVELCAVHTLFEAQAKYHPDTKAFVPMSAEFHMKELMSVFVTLAANSVSQLKRERISAETFSRPASLILSRQ